MSRRAALVLLAILTLGALLLRGSGIDHLLPEVMNRDGLVVVRQVEHFRAGGPVPDNAAWWYASYPHLMARVAAVLPAAAVPHEGARSLEEHLELARAPWIELRWISILFSILAVPGTYLLARRFLDRGGALFAAALIATSLHHVCLSIQEKPHAASASLVLLALIAALRLRRKPDLRSYLLCGATAALSIAMLHSGVVALLPIAGAFLLRERKPPRASAWWILAVLAIAAAAVRAFYPFFFEAIRDPIPETMAAAGPDAAGFAGKIAAGLRGAPLGRLLLAIFALDPLLVVLGTAGVALGCARRRLHRDLAVLLALALPTLIVLALFRGTLVRFFLPLYPLLACAGGYAFVCARDQLSPRASALGPALAAALVAIPLTPAFHFARIRREPGPLREASRWVVEHVDPGETIVVVPNVDLALPTTPDAISLNALQPWRTIWTEYLADVHSEDLEGVRWPILIEPGRRPESRREFGSDPLGYLRRYRARWLVLDISGGGEQLLDRRAERVARFSPAREDRPGERGVMLFGMGIDPFAPSALRILGMKSLGTAVEIFEIP
ncbi:MAG: glycosyltransferase family 39 protein [Planctomycetota bacterium]